MVSCLYCSHAREIHLSPLGTGKYTQQRLGGGIISVSLSAIYQIGRCAGITTSRREGDARALSSCESDRGRGRGYPTVAVTITGEKARGQGTRSGHAATRTRLLFSSGGTVDACPTEKPTLSTKSHLPSFLPSVLPK